ncbi:hypothetical protein [Sabulicella glaciei]|uniref:Uncharacterized protein n=1 Tax=Sabulicella glaciei TaxID=2984948 RepID=A0ABT3NVI9_9PROT|nr:hypothetical protein [Roseococcus sp. MDT2-1-1]MCW8086155.1 hypothetical protein [Roseococcus sp. MDT2-1-1]
MAWTLDARIPVSFGAPPPGRAWAWIGEAPLPGAVAVMALALEEERHAAGCACCGGRSAAAEALDRLFQDRVRGRCPWFDAVAVSPDAAEAVREALRGDALAAARFREAA